MRDKSDGLVKIGRDTNKCPDPNYFVCVLVSKDLKGNGGNRSTLDHGNEVADLGVVDPEFSEILAQ
jgi:hypothetical protein